MGTKNKILKITEYHFRLKYFLFNSLFIKNAFLFN